MNFKFEVVDGKEYLEGSYLMDFGKMESQEDAVIVEGKLLATFGDPADMSENYENSFNYFIRTIADDGQSAILNVYGMGVVHIGAAKDDDFTQKAANALIEYVMAATPQNYQRTVYYLDFDIQINISLNDGEVTISTLPIPEEKVEELYSKLY